MDMESDKLNENRRETAEAGHRVHGVLDGIARACHDVGRDPAQVRLLPVSKTHPIEALRAVNEALDEQTGHRAARLFGENHVQEIVAKTAQKQADDDFGFALIGHLQSNKVNAVAELIDEFQALDSLKLARRLDRRLDSAGRSLRVLVEVNTSGEPAKHGVDPEQAYDFCASLAPFRSLEVAGLMTVAVNSSDQARVAACFDRLVVLAGRLRDDAVLDSQWSELSMGMSGDYPLAIAHGSTTVRVGTALFGPRDYDLARA